MVFKNIRKLSISNLKTRLCKLIIKSYNPSESWDERGKVYKKTFDTTS